MSTLRESAHAALAEIDKPPTSKTNGWLRDGSLLYRLTDERRPSNRDEIRVTMADGLRSEAACSKRAAELFDLICAAETLEARQ